MDEEGQTWNPPAPDERFRLDRAEQPPQLEFRPEECLPIVVGGMPRAEWLDRPYATRLARMVRAWQATRLPRSLVVDGSFAIHCDPEFLDGGVCLWGEGAAGLDAAFEAFATRYLDRYLRQMHLAAT